MTDAQQREAARQFFYKWNGKGKEDEDARSYWIDVLVNIFGMENVTDRVQFEKKVAGEKSKKRIDVYIPETHVLIEQKSLGIPLDKPQPGHDNKTPYEQAKEYDNLLPYDEKARWIITSNFAEIWVYDMAVMKPEPVKITLADIQSKFHMLDFLLDKEVKKVSDEMKVSLQAGDLVGKLYDAFLRQYRDPESDETLKSLNKLCVRIVFCLYAEDAGIFGKKNMFHDYMQQFDATHARKGLRDLFRILNQETASRDRYLADDDPTLAAFPYVNGGLFNGDDIEIPPFTDEIMELLLRKASDDFDWSEISPTIFGAVFESTLNPETRRAGGMHYTSIENIHKVIDPLFLDALALELDTILYDNPETPEEKRQREKRWEGLQREEVKARAAHDSAGLRRVQAEISRLKSTQTKTRNASLSQRLKELDAFQKKIAGLTFLDPACGSGNFLTETYLSLRRLENRVIAERIKITDMQGQATFGDTQYNPIAVSISQFYGIEINDFAVTVARTALWIAENQMMRETEEIVHMALDFLPLKTNAYIIEGNALRLDWKTVIGKSRLSYIMGNPPFVGSKKRGAEQREDVKTVIGDWDNSGNLDYVACWFRKAADYMSGTTPDTKACFVSTNSITQGEEVGAMWKPLSLAGVHIDFAYRTFTWDSEANAKAHVHCVIIGFSCGSDAENKAIYENGEKLPAKNINGYLMDAEDVFLDRRQRPINGAPEIIMGPMSISGNHLILTADERNEILASEPDASKWIRRFSMGREFIDGSERYCLWLQGISPHELNELPMVKERVRACREYREKQKPTGDAYKYRETPHLFRPAAKFDPEAPYLALPQTSSQRRRYIPMDFILNGMIPGQKLYIISNASLYHFGVMVSNVHMAWMRTTCGRMKSDYSYSVFVVYNNFPWPSPTDDQKAKIEAAAQNILDARALYPDCSLADLYDPLTMPPELRKAHAANDRAVMQAYGMPIKETDEAACVAWLMRLYQELTQGSKQEK